MKKREKTRTKVAVSLLALVMLLGLSPLVMAEEPLFLADANLKAAVEDALGISDPTPTDMLALGSLSAPNRGIVDLTGLEYALNLTDLRLNNNQISDISALSGLPNLTLLQLSNNQISDISALSGLTNLTWLFLHSNQISDISALSVMTNLTQLFLQRNPLNIDAYNIYLPLIQENNSGVDLRYDPNPFPGEPPAADAGPNQTVFVGETVQLDGSGSSDPDGDPLTFDWTITKPAGSTAVLSDPALVNPTFVTDVAGEYVVQLIVHDNTAGSDPDQVSITAQTCQEATEDVIDTVADQVSAGVLNAGTGDALISKLDGAVKKLDKGNTNPACNELGAFINQVNALINSGRLTPEEGQELKDAAQRVIDELCG